MRGVGRALFCRLVVVSVREQVSVLTNTGGDGRGDDGPEATQLHTTELLNGLFRR